MVAIIQAYKEGFLSKRFFIKNLIAGLFVGIIALPLAMAFAIASGAKPEQGIYTAIIAGITVSIFGGSRVQIAGPTGAFIVVLAGITAQHGIIGLQIATLMAGIILIVFGFLKLGGIIKFIPTPVILGFTAGIGVVICVSQWPSFLGIPSPKQTYFHDKLSEMLAQFIYIDVITIIFGTISLAILLIIPKIKIIKWLPASLFVLVISTSFQALFQFPTVATIGSSFGGIKQGLPEFIIPTFSFVTFTSLIGPAFAIAMLGAIESLLSATVADNMTKAKHNPNQELIGQGIANILAPIFGGFAATGAIARTAANIKNGGSSPISGIVHGLFLLSVLVFMAPLATHIPLSSLAAILFVVAWNMSEVKEVFKLFKQAPLADSIILCITFFLTVFTDLIIAVNVGVLIAILYFLKQASNHVTIKLGPLPLEYSSIHGCKIHIQGPLFFASLSKLDNIISQTDSNFELILFDFEQVPFTDATGLEKLKITIDELQSTNIRVQFIGMSPLVTKQLKRAKIH